MRNRKDKLGSVAMAKTSDLQSLIDTLNNTTVGGLSNDIAKLTTKVNSQDILINNLQDSLTLAQSKIDSISAIFNILFDSLGAITQESYSAHTHQYSDLTIGDTADGTGVASSTPKNTQGVT